ncbi:putative CRISPR associated hypothetical protein [Methanosarcina sp. WWM596]|nr:putative CRISPR associated hypothetical protein [Methanosarcina sp. WWM596]
MCGHTVDEIRFIPTRVGNSIAISSFSLIQSVHPHACGELITNCCFVSTSTGSSPRVWGTRSIFQLQYLPLRFIPTRVGNSLTFYIQYAPITVHPHACGELALKQLDTETLSGSSPRVWGTHQIKEWRFSNRRFIPTRVGNSRLI